MSPWEDQEEHCLISSYLVVVIVQKSSGAEVTVSGPSGDSSRGKMPRRDFLRAVGSGAVAIAVGDLVAGCGGGGGGGNSGGGTIQGEGLTTAQADSSDSSTPLSPAALDQLILSDGRSVRDILNQFGKAVHSRDGGPTKPKDYIDVAIARMLETAQSFTNRSLWQYPDEGPSKPAQNGLAYSYGSKDPSIRQKPPAGCCTDEVHGLDCSGLLYRAALAAGLGVPPGTAATQGLVQTWNSAIPAQWGVAMRNVDQTVSNYANGDIIYWAGAGHIGIVEVTGDAPAGVSIIQSNGVPGCDNTVQQCLKNRGDHRGPNRVPLVQILNWGLGPAAVLRLVASLDHVEASSTTVAPGQSITVTAKDVGGDPVSGDDLAWSSDSANVTVPQSGNPAIVSASHGANGPARISATQKSTGKSADVSVTVTDIRSGTLTCVSVYPYRRLTFSAAGKTITLDTTDGTFGKSASIELKDMPPDSTTSVTISIDYIAPGYEGGDWIIRLSDPFTFNGIAVTEIYGSGSQGQTHNFPIYACRYCK